MTSMLKKVSRCSIRSSLIYKVTSLIAVMGFAVTFFVGSGQVFHAFVSLALFTAMVWICDLWFRSLPSSTKVIWTTLMVLFNVIALPIYWFLFIKSGRGLEASVDTPGRSKNRKQESFLCGVLGVFIGPFALFPGILLAHAYCREAHSVDDKKGSLPIFGAFALNYSLLVIWAIAIGFGVKEYFEV